MPGRSLIFKNASFSIMLVVYPHNQKIKKNTIGGQDRISETGSVPENPRVFSCHNDMAKPDFHSWNLFWKASKTIYWFFSKRRIELKKNVPTENEVRSCSFSYKFGHWACHTLSLDSAILIIKIIKINTNKTKQNTHNWKFLNSRTSERLKSSIKVT